jgi:uncharacterized protein YndB with AHSA1/START domain
MQNTIEQQISIKANIDKVYEAISNPIKIVTWFPISIEGTLNTGDTPILDFGEHGKNQIRVVSANPHTYFAYRWVPGSRHYIGELNEANSTLVEFKLEEKDGFTFVQLTESGFANLQTEQAERAIKENSGGWEYMLGRLEKIFSGK